MEKCLIPVLNYVFDKNTCDEWIGTYLQPLMKQLTDCRDRGTRVIEQPPQPPRSQETRSVTFATDLVQEQIIQEAPLVPDILPQMSQNPQPQPPVPPSFDPMPPIYDQPRPSYYGPMQY